MEVTFLTKRYKTIGGAHRHCLEMSLSKMTRIHHLKFQKVLSKENPLVTYSKSIEYAILTRHEDLISILKHFNETDKFELK
jgi:hypothetical protein